jgi:hypothetical protein
MSLSLRSVSVFSGVAAVVAACGGNVAPPTMQGRAGMLSQTAVAQRCDEAKKGHERPFVVEWDATDLASFEAKASRDTVFVRYEGCSLQVLDRCSDADAPGKLGAYGTPTFTSGTVQGFDISNEGELYAKLPLGAASLSGRVQAGESLHLQYYVSGVAQNTRDAIYEGDLASNPGCKGATHFVWAYNLGAFELTSSENVSGETDVGAAGVGSAGGKRSSQRRSVSSGGKLSSCESQDQRGCRVPIRLALRPITAGQNPVEASPAVATKGDEATTVTGESAASNAVSLVARAKERLEAGDGASCVDLLAKAVGFDARLVNDNATKKLRARCLMASGKCVDGTRDYRAALAAADTKRELEDWQLDNAARDESNRWCPSAGTTNHADFIARAFRELRAMEKVKDRKGCERLADGLAEHKKAMLAEMRDMPTAERMKSELASNLASNGLLTAARCVAAATGRCSDALSVLLKECKTVETSGCVESVKKGFEVTRSSYTCK